MKSFLIIGMGTFGHHLCKSLAQYKCEMMIADINPENVEDMLGYVAGAKICDCTNPAVLESFDIPSFDACFVCIGSNFQNSLEITSLLKELGAKKVFSKATEDIQAKFLLRCGADEVIYPERDAALRVAARESSDSIFDYFQLSGECAIYEIEVSPKWVGKSIAKLDIRRKYGVSIFALKEGTAIRPVTSPDHVFKEKEHVLVFGYSRDIEKIITR